MVTGDGIGQPANAPGQEARILAWLLTEPGGLTQLQALSELAVQRLAAMVHRLKGRGHNIRTELVTVPTRYGDAVVARYHLVHLAKGAKPAACGLPADTLVRLDHLHPDDRPSFAPREQPDLFRAPRYRCATCCDMGRIRNGPGSVLCPATECAARDRLAQVGEAYGGVVHGG